MNAALQAGREAAALRPMREADVEAVHDVERRAYEFPWTAGIFRDCLRADYMAWVLERDGAILGYFLLSLAAGEAHVLNIAVAPERHGRRMLRSLVHLARSRAAQRVFLEVRPSNSGAIALYHQEGFNEIGRRPRYYPARDGREDAIVMAMELLPD
jgi:ribosomal-protein-alanine N-acetyltransferase